MTSTTTEPLGWFADQSEDRPGLWAPMVQVPGACHELGGIWFDTEADAQEFIHTYLTGLPCIDDCCTTDTDQTQPARGTTLRLTPLDTAGNPTGTAVVIGGWFQLGIDRSGIFTARLEATIAPDGPQLIATREPVMLELWSPLPGFPLPGRTERWMHFTIHALDHLLPADDRSSPDGFVAFTGHILTVNTGITTYRSTSERPEHTP